MKIATEFRRRLEQRSSDKRSRKTLDVYLNVFYRITAKRTKPVPNVSETLRILPRKVRLPRITIR